MCTTQVMSERLTNYIKLFVDLFKLIYEIN